MTNAKNGKGTADGREPRCIALVGPFGSGKTSLFEAILARTGKVARQGTVADGNTLGDASPEARAHGMSVELNIAETEFLGDKFVFVDCPGSVEFLGEMDGALSGVDMAIVVAEDDERKVPALQLILKALEARSIPRALFLNKIDKSTRGIRDVLTLLQPASEVPMVLRQIPIWENGVATGFIDLALERAHVYHEKEPSTQIDMSDADLAREHEARFTMLELLADHDDDLMEALLEDIAPEREQIFADLVNEMQDGLICPVFFGSAEHGHGISKLLKALRHETPTVDLLRKRLLDTQSGTAIQIIKTLHTAHGGKLSIARLLDGQVADGDNLFLKGATEVKVSGLFSISGQHASKISTASKGDLVGLGRMDEVQTGDVLSMEAAGLASQDNPDPRDPVLAIAIEASQRKDEVRLSSAVNKLIEEDGSLAVSQNQTTGETLLAGQGEMHLRVAQERLSGKYGLDISAHTPSVPYSESIMGKTTIRRRHKKQSGGHGQFGDVELEIAPLPRGEGIQFSDRITGGVVPKQYIPSVRDGVHEALTRGAMGFPVVDLPCALSTGRTIRSTAPIRPSRWRVFWPSGKV